MDIESFWEYSDPTASEERFRAALRGASGDERLELLTQIARTFSLRELFEEAHQLLDQVESKLSNAGLLPRVRYELERGRTFNSSSQPDPAIRHFQKAWEIAQASGVEGLAVDAAHMLAICTSGQPEMLEWTQRGLNLARKSSDKKALALIPALLNNAAWDLHDQGRYEEALPVFEDALREWTATGKTHQTLIARWSLARCLRSLERFDEALAMQLQLEDAHRQSNTKDGFVFEEIGENLWALGRTGEARTYLQKAFNLLKADEWLAQNQAERLKQLELRAGQEPGE